jgi:hypothetical protein
MRFSEISIQGMFNLCLQTRDTNPRKSGGSSLRSKGTAPHPIPKGFEGLACPITGLYADGSEAKPDMVNISALEELQADPDIVAEHDALAQKGSHVEAIEQVERPLTCDHFVPLNVVNRAHTANSDTRRLVRMVGLDKLRSFTAAFYDKCFVDPHVDQFLRRHTDPHAERFALWIVEKFGDGTPWTNERKTRPRDLMRIGGHVAEVAYDRSSAHFAAWHSPKREAHKYGQHFKLDDARVWMRLHFWAAREVGLFAPPYAAFMDYYMRFIGHFVSIYSRHSPPFTRESARWSANPDNIEKYLASGNMMFDVIDKPVETALAELPVAERVYTGSAHPDPAWPYEKVPRN